MAEFSFLPKSANTMAVAVVDVECRVSSDEVVVGGQAVLVRLVSLVTLNGN